MDWHPRWKAYPPTDPRTHYPVTANITERQSAPPALAISTAIFALHHDAERARLWLPLVRRVRHPFRGRWALPGGPLAATESLEEAAARNLAETTGVRPRYLEQLYAFGGLHRGHPSQGRRVVSIVYWALVQADQLSNTAPGTPEQDNVCWFPADELGESIPEGLAFDHAEIVEYALWRLRTKVEYGSIAQHLVGERFTLTQLRQVYEAVLNRPLDPANFRRQLRGDPQIHATDEFQRQVQHRPSRLYRYLGPAGSADDRSWETPGTVLGTETQGRMFS